MDNYAPVEVFVTINPSEADFVMQLLRDRGIRAVVDSEAGIYLSVFVPSEHRETGRSAVREWSKSTQI
jgi:hypothetical protein